MNWPLNCPKLLKVYQYHSLTVEPLKDKNATLNFKKGFELIILKNVLEN